MAKVPDKTVKSSTTKTVAERKVARKETAQQFVSRKPELATTSPTQEHAQRRVMKISAETIARMRKPMVRPSQAQENPFKLPKLLSNVVGEDQEQLAFDNDIEGFQNGLAGSGIPVHGMWAEGIGFMGYPYLAMLMQRSEYRQPVEVLAEEMTRKWIKIKDESGDNRADDAQALNDAQEKFQLRDRFREALEIDGAMGLAFLYIDLLMPDGKTPVWENAEELKLPLLITKEKIGKDSLRGFKPIDPTWVAPNVYDSNNPMSDTFYKPQIWWIMGRQVHASRLITIISRPVPDLLKPAYNFGGLSLSQLMKPYVDNWLSTRQAVNDLINAFTVWVLSTNMEAVLQDDLSGTGGAGFEQRINLFAETMNNRGVMALDKESEELGNISVPLGSLDKLQAQAQEHQAAPARIPLVKLFGITPSGLNASTDGEIRVFYDSINGMQQRVCGDGVALALDVIQLSENGAIDDELTHEFVHLWQLDEAGQAAAQKTEADRDAVLIEANIISPEEARNALAASDGPYAGLEGPPPEIPDMTDMDADPNDDDAKRVSGAGANNEETGANSGV